jgi:pimeloyl-ACP methyl ester carboxylesterase
MSSNYFINYNRENLILVSGFLVNGVILKGLVEHLGEVFNVFFIDLPGFSSEVRPLSNSHLYDVKEYIENKIDALNPDSFIIGGISYGFLFVNLLKLDNPKCKGVLAIEPYIDSRYLSPKLRNRIWHLKLPVKMVRKLGLHRFFWKIALKNKNLSQALSSQIIEQIYKEVEPRSFFEALDTILTYKGDCVPHQIPHALIMNKEDDVVDFPSLYEYFSEHVPKFKYVEIEGTHFPEELSKDYFQRILPKEKLMEVIDFISDREHHFTEYFNLPVG